MPQAHEQEIEIKRMLLGDKPVEALLRVLGCAQPTQQLQVNHVFDTARHDLRRARFALRVRDESGRYTLTAKGPSVGTGASTVIRTEAEVELAADVAAQVLSGQLDPIMALRAKLRSAPLLGLADQIERACGGHPIIVLGRFENLRCSIPTILPTGEAFVLELDSTTLPDGRIDHEAEIELRDPQHANAVEAWLEALASKAGVETADAHPKVARFFDALGATTP